MASNQQRQRTHARDANSSDERRAAKPAPKWLRRGAYPAFLPTGLCDPRDMLETDVALPRICRRQK